REFRRVRFRSFLHSTGVAHASDQHFALGEVEDHATVGVGAVAFRITLKVHRVQDLPLVLAGRIVGVRADEKGVGEQIVPGGLGGDLHRQVVLFGGANVKMGNKAV